MRKIWYMVKWQQRFQNLVHRFLKHTVWKDLVLYVLTSDLIENAPWLFLVCLWKVGPYVCSGNAEIEPQCSQGKEDTKLGWNMYTPTISDKIKWDTLPYVREKAVSSLFTLFQCFNYVAKNLNVHVDLQHWFGDGSRYKVALPNWQSFAS